MRCRLAAVFRRYASGVAAIRIPWPLSLAEGDLLLRPLHRRDLREWQQLRRTNVDWLREWEATLPVPDPTVPNSYRAMVRGHARDAREGRSLSLAMALPGQLIGQITLGGLSWGSLRAGHIGYWIGKPWAGRGLTPLAVALICDYAFSSLNLHRIEINVRPENRSSLAVVGKLGFRYEGMRKGYLHINGDWRDHLTYVMLAEERPMAGVVAQVAAQGMANRG